MVPRLLRLEIVKQWVTSATVAASSSSGWAPRELLANGSFFPPSSLLRVKRSTSRFFMYEEHGATKLEDNNQTQVVQLPPSKLADWLHEPPIAPEKHPQQQHHQQQQHCYWTSPVAHVAPTLLTQRLQGYEALHRQNNHSHNPDVLDPRGPSLWMGTNGSATQAHYDVADNVIVQLFGTKRIRCYPPKAATALYVFPDAHPRARKSQVNFDAPDSERFPHVATLAPPVLDVILTPGDAIWIPAFWFHHVENGRTASLTTTTTSASTPQDQQQEGPSVSANIFALSSSMIIAQGIFRDASRPLGNLAAAPSKRHNPSLEAQQHHDFAVAALRALGFGLIDGLVQRLGMTLTPVAFIQTCLLDTRYAPLRLNHGGIKHHTTTISRGLTTSEQKQVAKCLERILPQFAKLLEEGDSDPDGIVSLVACHLLELWAVELVGAPSLADAWQTALLRDD
jgi:Cupin-like domain